jgi:hypothetical protein
MDILSLPEHVASADAVLNGPHGAVSRLARQRGQSRQQLYRQAHCLADSALPDRRRQRFARLRRRLARLRRRCRQLRRQLRHAAVCDPDRRARFACTAQAEGVSLPVAQRLLAVFLGQDTPSVATLGRDAHQAAQRAAALLEVLDEHSRPKVRQAAGDEMFVGPRPVLMVVEQHSLCWQVGRLAKDRTGQTWAEHLKGLTSLEQLSKDDGSGLAKGLALVNQQRRELGQAEVADQADHFHLLREGRRALRRVEAQAQKAATAEAEAAAQLARADRQGHKRTGPAARLRLRARKAEAALGRWVRQGDALERLRQRLKLFTPDGRLNSRAQGEAAVAAALEELTGPEWEKFRRQVSRKEVWTFLDRVADGLSGLPEEGGAKALLVRAEGLLARPELSRAEGPAGAAARGVLLVVAALLAAGGERLGRLRSAIRGALVSSRRSSSVVEGLNSVLRMSQGRHRRLTQGLLDLKRLYWNLRPFRTGPRKGKTPYQLLGLGLGVTDWWDVLQLTPEQLRQQLSAPPLVT